MQHRRRDAARQHSAQPAAAVAADRDEGRPAVPRSGKQTRRVVSDEKVRLVVVVGAALGVPQCTGRAQLQRDRRFGVSRGRRSRHRHQQQPSLRRTQAGTLAHGLLTGRRAVNAAEHATEHLVVQEGLVRTQAHGQHTT
jgi:hypothetical protein